MSFDAYIALRIHGCWLASEKKSDDQRHYLIERYLETELQKRLKGNTVGVIKCCSRLVIREIESLKDICIL